MMHFKDTVVAAVPLQRGEAQYFVFTGEKIFRHRDVFWMRVFHHEGHRVMIPVPEELIEEDPRLAATVVPRHVQRL
jgi:3-deoxy-D-manno-octulosonic-acid transferase